MADIFVSYASQDRSLIAPLVGRLEAEGYSVWWDRRIEAGAEFSKNIENELNDSRVVIVAWSASANASSWVKDEASAGHEQGKLIPICIDGERPPMGFRQYQALEFTGWKGNTSVPAYDDLCRSIRSRLAGEAVPEVVSWVKPTIKSRPFATKNIALWSGIVCIVLLGGYVAFSLLGSASLTNPSTTASTIRLDSTPWISVKSIEVRSEDSELANLGASLTEDIATGLSRFSYLLVASKSSMPGLQGGRARYVLEGTLQEAGATRRLSMRLMDTHSGAQIWGETYNRDFSTSNALIIQDDLTDRVVASVADPYGALMRDLSSNVALKSTEEMTAYEAVLRHFIYRQRLSPEDHLISRRALEHAAKKEPENAGVWAALAAIYIEEHKHGYNRLPDAKGRALRAARRGTELEPNNAAANFALAEVYYFSQNLGAFQAAAERAIALNPRDSDAMAMIGIMMGYGGNWVRGVELTTRAMALNPNHPGWYRFSTLFNEYRLGNYDAALKLAQRLNLPDYFPDAYSRAATHAQLGNKTEAAAALREFLELWPDPSTLREKHLDVWYYAQPDMIDQIIDGLQKAGLEIE